MVIISFISSFSNTAHTVPNACNDSRGDNLSTRCRCYVSTYITREASCRFRVPRRVAIKEMLFFNMKCVAHALLLCAHVAQVVLVRSYLDGDIFGDFQTVGLDAHALDGIVGHEAHLGDTELA